MTQSLEEYVEERKALRYTFLRRQARWFDDLSDEDDQNYINIPYYSREWL
jgi:hypothetical protein